MFVPSTLLVSNMVNCTFITFLQGPDNYWSLHSTLKRYDQFYSLTITYKDGVTKKEREQTMKKYVFRTVKFIEVRSECVVPEYIHTFPTEGIDWKSLGGGAGGSQRPKN